MVPINAGQPDKDGGLVRVMRPQIRSGILVIDVEEIYGAAHLISDTPQAKEHDSWTVNSHIDLETWNKVYVWEE